MENLFDRKGPALAGALLLAGWLAHAAPAHAWHGGSTCDARAAAGPTECGCRFGPGRGEAPACGPRRPGAGSSLALKVVPADSYMGRHRQDLENALAPETTDRSIRIEPLENHGLRLTLSAEVFFDFDSSRIRVDHMDSLDRLAHVLAEYERTTLLIVGHTDNVGSDAYNLDLSYRRAQITANYLTRRTVDRRRIQVEGRGEREPRTSNATEAGRQLNRRVEIHVRPVVKGRVGDVRA